MSAEPSPPVHDMTQGVMYNVPSYALYMCGLPKGILSDLLKTAGL